MESLRAECLRTAGPTAIRDLRRGLLGQNGPLTLQQLRTALQKVRVSLPDVTLRAAIAEAGATPGEEGVDRASFLQRLQGTMNARRYDAVRKAFDVLDRNMNDTADLFDVRGRFDAREHGKVISGEVTEDDILQEFLRTFDTATYPSGVVTRGDFEAYYAGVSAEIEDDSYFETLVYNTWQLDDEPPRNKHIAFTVQQLDRTAAFAEERGLGTHSQGTRTINPSTYRGGPIGAPPPRRVVGYTGHVPGMLDAHGVSFHHAERTAPEVVRKPTLPQAPPAQART